MEPIVFAFDFISPYAYLAWNRIFEVAERHGRKVEMRPVLLAALLDANGSKGPAEIPAKRMYTGKHVARLAHDARLPLVPPPTHPFNPLLALRVASVPMDDAVRRRLIDALYQAVWAGGGGVENKESVGRVIRSVELDPAATFSAALAPENKERLKRATADLIASGGFGVPTMLVDGELFWGQDSFPHLEAFLRGEDGLDRAFFERWLDLPASARRPGA